ncbi:hypothetical protein QCD83_19995 [Pseudomonas savastanoi pv. phaseolicola]|nr:MULTISPECIES: hypothetical protein [Pseudomonas]KPB33377.1 Unknown protein sequence [Pseudomonas savastanoi pv. phaseolicola]KPB47794.1 Unknown protein sequence [Pseudomonas savastanoi pv. phaseolicola]KPB53391.1 Unknown protein sequence [Pseudomonas savastanoi pv. phaseolicola]KPB70770.1 Unknown protein sequence [Pseudomonas amygdali pv. mellea]MDG6381149.1 hypothetical protein [Pseudomonas savastanoi pv. phaseolicola]
MSMFYGLLLRRMLAVVMIVVVVMVMCGGILDRRTHSLRSRILLVAK